MVIQVFIKYKRVKTEIRTISLMIIIIIIINTYYNIHRSVSQGPK